MTLRIVEIFFAAAAATLMLTTMRHNNAQADPISLSDFGSSATIESFERLHPGTNIPLVDIGFGYLKPGVNGPFTFHSGVTLTGPIPNIRPPAATGILIGDFSLGPAGFGLGENGHIDSAEDVPDGSAYLALDAHPGPIEFTFPADILRVGALVSGSPTGFITLSAFDSSGNLLETVSVSKVNVSNWRSNFLGLENRAGIRKITFSDSDAWIGYNTIVLDSLTVKPGFAELGCIGRLATIVGTAGDDVLLGTPGPDVIVGLGGNDTLIGLGGRDVLCGDAGNDTLRGGFGLDFLDGGAGNDQLYGEAGSDYLRGKGGRDQLFGGSGPDELLGGPDDDVLNGEADPDVCDGGRHVQGDTALNCEVIRNVP